MLISIEGNIGSGKTEFIRRLQEELKKRNFYYDVNFVYEPIHKWVNSFNKSLLKLYYSNPRKHCFDFQSSIFENYNNALVQYNEKSSIVFTERSLLSSFNIFCQLGYDKRYLSQEQIRYLYTQYKIIDSEPDYTIYLKCSPETCLRRIRNRQREGEIITLSYLRDLDERHNNFYLNNPERSNVIVYDAEANMDVEEFNDFVRELIKTIDIN